MSEVNPYAAPEAGAEYADGEFRFPEGEYGGIGRLAYFGFSFLIGIVQNVLQFAIAASAGQDGAALIFIPLILGLAASIYIVVLRMKNMGYSGWWAIGIIVPILNILVGLRCVCCPEGYADHKKLDKAGKILVGIFVGLIVLAIVAVVIAAAAGN